MDCEQRESLEVYWKEDIRSKAKEILPHFCN